MNFKQEAKLFGSYLVGNSIDEKATILYETAMKCFDISLSIKDAKLLSICLKYPILLGPIDCGLIFVNSKSVIRKKIFIMCAILESLPEYNQFYLPKKGSFYSIVKLFLIGVFTIFKTIVGIVFLKIINHE